jgi:hypothetical protein
VSKGVGATLGWFDEFHWDSTRNGVSDQDPANVIADRTGKRIKRQSGFELQSCSACLASIVDAAQKLKASAQAVIQTGVTVVLIQQLLI